MTTASSPSPSAIESLALRLPGEDRSDDERCRLARLVTLLAWLPLPPSGQRLFPLFTSLQDLLRSSLQNGNGESIEEAFLELYCHLHMHEAPYTPRERRVVDASGGYWAHAGGVSPLLRAGRWISPTTVSADYGAGNGLQGLLLQWLDPHALTVQIEISSRMVAIGRRLAGWLGIAPERLRWLVADVRDVPPVGLDFIYLYRPLRPEGPGDAFYRNFAATLEAQPRPVVVFSVADCLRGYLSDRFELLSSDGHLTCVRGPVNH
jgi:hypothetical protein